MESGRLWITLTFVAVAFMTLLYLFRVFNLIFLGEARIAPVKEGSPTMVVSVAALGLLSLVSGIFIAPSFQFAQSAVQQMLGVAR